MAETNFEISKSRKEFGGIIFAFGLCEAFLIIGTVLSKSGMRILGIIASITFFTVCSFAVLSVFLFKVKVVDSTISVRTDLGRCYSFYISEISGIACEVLNDTEHGYTGRIKIEIKNQKLYLRQTMNRFQEMAGYILEKLESGEINEAAVSVDVKSRLIKCKNEKPFI